MSEESTEDLQPGEKRVDDNGDFEEQKSSYTVPKVETVKRRTIKAMKTLGTHRPEYNPLIEVYAHLVNQYYQALSDFELKGDGEYETMSAAGTLKSSPYANAMEKLRKDILTYSDRLMLNPKSMGEEVQKQEKQTKLGVMLSKLN